jgi:hypothetical protein
VYWVIRRFLDGILMVEMDGKYWWSNVLSIVDRYAWSLRRNDGIKFIHFYIHNYTLHNHLCLVAYIAAAGLPIFLCMLRRN